VAGVEQQHGQRSVPMHPHSQAAEGAIIICVSRIGNAHTGAEVGKSDPRCSWQDHSRRVAVGDESTEFRSVFQPLCIPSVICPECRSSIVVVRWTDELLCGGNCVQWVSRFENPCIHTRWTGETWVEQMFRRHGTTC